MCKQRAVLKPQSVKRLLAGGLDGFDFDRAKNDLRRAPPKVGRVLRSDCTKAERQSETQKSCLTKNTYRWKLITKE